MATNRKMGNSFEAEFCELLFDKGFWVHNLAQNQTGQPADVIAVKNGKAHLIDCKVCSNDNFSFSRIEGNQHTAMRFWEDCKNGFGYFALKLTDGSIYMMNYEVMMTLALSQSSINKRQIEYFGISLDDWWLEQC